MDKKAYLSLSVHDLVDPLFRAGDIDDRVYNQETMAEGTRIHSAYQKKQGDGYLSEYPLSGEVEVDEGTISLYGRADGISKLGADGDVMVEEIKSTVMGLDAFFETQRQWHLSQAEVYAYLYLKGSHGKKAEIKLTYIAQGAKDESMAKLFSFTFEELDSDVKSYVREYLSRYAKRQEEVELRNHSAGSLRFPFDGFRKGQKELSRYAYAALKKGGTLFAEAPTGIGKTVSVLYPAMRLFHEGLADKVFYLTAKTTGSDVALATFRRFLEQGFDARCSIIYSKERVCLRPGHSCNPDDCPFAKEYYTKLNFAKQKAAEEGRVYDSVFLSKFCRENSICPFEFQLDLSEESDLIIADYNYLFDPFVRLERYFGDDRDPSRYVALIDEGHNLVERGRMMYSARIDSREAGEAVKSFEGSKRRISRSFVKIRKAIEDAEEEDQTRLAAFPEALTSSIEGMQRAMLENRKKQGGGMPKRAKDFARECNRLYRLLDGPAASSQAFRLYFSSSRGRSANLYCLDPSSFLAHSMSRLKACVVFSATLSPMHYYVTSITGGDDSPRISFPSPFDPAKMKLLLAPYVSTKYKDRKGSLSDLCSLLELFVAGRKGNYFIFFPSYEYLRQAELCLSFPGAEVYSQTRDMDIESRLSFLEHFPSNPECSHVGLLVMGGPFSEGIDLPEDRLIGVAVVGVGMPQISFENDLIREYRDQKEEDGFAYAYRDPGLNKVMQALGRLIRTENDVGAGLLIDTRYLTSPYREPIGKRYPNYEVVLSEDDLKNSLASFYKKAKLI